MGQLARNYKAAMLILLGLFVGFLSTFVDNHILHTLLVLITSLIGLVVSGLLYTSIEKGIDQLNKSHN